MRLDTQVNRLNFKAELFIVQLLLMVLALREQSTTRKIQESPRLCRGGTQSLTYTGVHLVSRQATQETEKLDGRPKTLNHSKWECKYHVVFIPKYRKKTIYVELRPHLGVVLRDLAKRKGCEIEEGHVMVDHVHMLISISPKYAVSQVIGYMKGKAAIYIARNFAGKKRNFVGQNFWGRGYFVSTVGGTKK